MINAIFGDDLNAVQRMIKQDGIDVNALVSIIII